MKVGDLVVKQKGIQASRVGIVVRVYNKNNGGHVILDVLSAGEFLKWSSSWCSIVPEGK